MDDTTFDLKADSAAIIFHSDMSTELILPKMDDEETVDFDTNQNIFISMAIVSLLDDEGFRKYVGTKLETMLETADALREDTDDAVIIPNCTCGPEDCSCKEILRTTPTGIKVNWKAKWYHIVWGLMQYVYYTIKNWLDDCPPPTGYA